MKLILRCVFRLLFAAQLLTTGVLHAASINVIGTTTYNQIMDASNFGDLTYTNLAAQIPQNINVSLQEPFSAFSGFNPTPPGGVGLGYMYQQSVNYSLTEVPTQLQSIFNDALSQQGVNFTLNDISFGVAKRSVTTERFMWSPSTTGVAQITQVLDSVGGNYSDSKYNYIIGLTSVFISNNHNTFSSSSQAVDVALTPYHLNDLVGWINTGANSTNDFISYTRCDLQLSNCVNFARFVFGSANVVASVSSVPEPDTHAMLLSGLGLIVAAVKRRKGKQV